MTSRTWNMNQVVRQYFIWKNYQLIKLSWNASLFLMIHAKISTEHSSCPVIHKIGNAGICVQLLMEIICKQTRAWSVSKADLQLA